MQEMVNFPDELIKMQEMIDREFSIMMSPLGL